MILIITNRTDITSDCIVNELNQRELRFIRLNTEEFPNNILGSISLSTSGDFNCELLFKDREKISNLSEVKSVLYRRPIPPVPNSNISDDSIRKFCIDESYDFLRGLWYSLDSFWISDPESIRKAEHKIFQLKIAQKCNFEIPKTLITNNSIKLDLFRKSISGDIIIKPLYNGFIEKNLENPASMIYTTRISKSNQINPEQIEIIPSIYQEYVEKIADIRVTVIGRNIFSAKIVSNNKPENIPDWRYSNLENLEHSNYVLPNNIAESCFKLLKLLNLEFGAIDFALTRNKELIFLEINPNGQWAWLEKILKIPISKAIVDHLTNVG